jgi:hypothetical protein
VHHRAIYVLGLLCGAGCSLLAPSDHELFGGAKGTGGDRGPDFGNGGQASGGERATSGGSRMEDPSGGSAPQAGSDGSGETGGAAGGAEAGAPNGGSEAGAGGSTAGGSTSGGSTAGGSTSGGSTSGGSTSGGSTAGGSTSGGVAAGGKASGGNSGGGAGGGVLHCSPNPCSRGTCSEVSGGYKCTCPAGWGGTRCEVGSCTGLTCPASAPCRVGKASAIAVCYPSTCVGSAGLCLAENADGSGAAIIFEGRNPDFNPLMNGNWRNRAKYFGYLDDAHGGYVCVFPQVSEQGTPLVIPLGEVRTKAAGFGQSNSWPNPPTCSYP